MRKIPFELLSSAKDGRNFAWSFGISWEILVSRNAFVSQREMPASLYFLADMAPVTAMCRKIPPPMFFQAAPPQGTVSLSLCVTDTTRPVPDSAAGGSCKDSSRMDKGEEETTDFHALNTHRLLINP